jgi:hypothetical protein
MNRYIYKSQEIRFISSTNGEGYEHWSKEKFVVAKTQKEAMQKIIKIEKTKQIKLITTRKHR